MWRIKLLRFFAVFGWGLMIVLWPKTAGNEESHAGSSPGSGSELYHSDLTQSNFGMLGFHLFETLNGRRHWNIHSAFAELKRAENYTLMREVDAEFYASTTGNVVKTRSEHGSSFVETGIVDLEGNVKIRSAQGYEFEMDKVQYRGKEHEFHSDVPVSMKGPNPKRPLMLLSGKGLFARIDHERFILKKDVYGRRKLSTDQWVDVHSDSGEFFTDRQQAIFRGEARSKLPDTIIESEVFEISMRDGKEFLLASGDVRLTHREREGRAEKALIEVGSNVIVLEGKAEVGMGDNQIAGNRVILYTDEDRIEVTGAKGRLKQ